MRVNSIMSRKKKKTIFTFTGVARFSEFIDLFRRKSPLHTHNDTQLQKKKLGETTTAVLFIIYYD